MVQPFNFDRPARIAISITGYDAKRQVEMLAKKRKPFVPKKSVVTQPVPMPAPIHQVDKKSSPQLCDQTELDDLNSALAMNQGEANLPQKLKQIFDQEVDKANANNC